MNPNGSARDRVVMLVKNSFVFDARVRKEAQSLQGAGWDVSVVALHVPGATSQCERTPEGIAVWRVPQLIARRPNWLGPATATPTLPAQQATAPTDPDSLRMAAPSALLKHMWRLVAPLARRINAAVVDRRMKAVARGLSPHVVHAHDLNTLRVAHKVAKVTRARLVYDAHEFHRARNGMGMRASRAAARLEDRLAPKADLVITATETWANRLQEIWKGPRPLVIRNVPQAIDVPVAIDLREQLSIPVGSPILLYIGSIQSGRGIEECMAALSHLPTAHLAVLGYGSHQPQLERLRDAQNLHERVHFPGPVDNRQVVSWLAGADVGFCLIGNTSYSYFTSLPNKLFDYVQARLPVVASNFPEMGAVVQRWQIGEVCDPADPESIARAAATVLRVRDTYREPLARAAQALTWEAEAPPLVAAYGRLAHRASAPCP